MENPRVTRRRLEKLQRDDPEAFVRESLAVFVSSLSGFLPADSVHGACEGHGTERTRAQNETMACDLFMVLGSSLVVYPAAGFPRIAKRQGARLVIVNRDPTDQDEEADLVLHAEIGPTLSRVVGVN